MADEIHLTNDSAGSIFIEQQIGFSLANEASALAASASGVAGTFIGGPVLLYASASSLPYGRIVDFAIGVVQQPLSASGFVSGTVDAGVYINGVAALSTRPAIPMLATSAVASISAGATTYVGTNTGKSRINGLTVSAGTTSAVVNQASAGYSYGDMISFDYNARSVGSAAAGIAGRGLYGYVTLRRGAR